MKKPGAGQRTQLGGIINSFPKHGKLGFEIHVNAAGQAGITISSKLLQLAKVVHDKP